MKGHIAVGCEPSAERRFQGKLSKLSSSRRIRFTYSTRATQRPSMVVERTVVQISAMPVRPAHTCLMPKASPDTQPQEARHRKDTAVGNILTVAHRPIIDPNTMRA